MAKPEVEANPEQGLNGAGWPEFLPDGREITRAVLQAGSLLVTAVGNADADPEADVYVLRDCVLMALGEAELWLLPSGVLE